MDSNVSLLSIFIYPPLPFLFLKSSTFHIHELYANLSKLTQSQICSLLLLYYLRSDYRTEILVLIYLIFINYSSLYFTLSFLLLLSLILIKLAKISLPFIYNHINYAQKILKLFIYFFIQYLCSLFGSAINIKIHD